MAQEAILRELLQWIEINLNKPLSIDDIAKRAGYSKWHLQRMFKDLTGHAMGTYLRARRLTRSAHDLRATNRSILDIALFYCFDSQQTFTRAFKTQFDRTPAQYRRLAEWDFSGMQPPLLRLYNQPLPEPFFIQLPSIPLRGRTVSYSVSYRREGTLMPRTVIQSWKKFRNLFSIGQSLPRRFIALLSGNTKKINEDEQQLYYTCAVDADDAPENGELSDYSIPAGEYARFTYTGSFRGLNDFIVHIYCDVMPLHKLTRRASPDIEIFPTTPSVTLEFGMIQCDYYIPIRQAVPVECEIYIPSCQQKSDD